MIQSIPCPGCHRTLILVAETSLQAVLSCRHCSHQFVLGEMIEKELGFWEVVDDPQAPEASSAASAAAIQANDQTVEDADLELAEESEYVSPQSLMKKQAAKKNVDWSKFEPITHEQFERMRRKDKSAIWSTLSVLLGGLASLPIATLLIWHVLGKDPLQMGPVVARYAPWIVPTRFRPMDGQDFARSEFAPPAGQSGFRQFDSVLIQPESTEPTSTDAISPSLENSDRTSNNEQNIDNSVVSSSILPPRERRAPRAFPTPLNAPMNAPPVDAHLEIHPNVQGSTESVPATGENVFKLIDEVERSLAAWAARVDDQGNKQLAQQIYGGLASVALAVNEIPPSSPLRRLIRNELRTTSKTIEEQGEIQQLIQAGSRHWLPKLQADASGGAAFVIEVVEASERDGSWQIAATSPTPGSPNLAIVAPVEVTSALLPGQRIFVLGVTVAESASADTAGDLAAEVSKANEVNELRKSGGETERPALRVNAGFIFVLSSEVP